MLIFHQDGGTSRPGYKKCLQHRNLLDKKPARDKLNPGPTKNPDIFYIVVVVDYDFLTYLENEEFDRWVLILKKNENLARPRPKKMSPRLITESCIVVQKRSNVLSFVFY